MTKNVAIYARVSTEHEAQIAALGNQVQYYDDILAKHPDWILYKRYVDEGITRTSVNKRKNFLKMIEDAENGCFDLIITREVSRFARNTVDTLQETRKLKKIGVEVYFTEDNIWTLNDDDGELKLTIMATLAQNESKKISQRVKAGMRISMLNGVFYGTGNILGYDKVGKNMIVNEEQAKIVKFIFQLFLDGKGVGEIKTELEQNGYLTATGLKKWTTTAVNRVLRNQFYCGTIVYRKEFVRDYLEQKKIKNKGQVEKIVVEGTHESIISKDDFYKVQHILDSRASIIKEKEKNNTNVPKNIWGTKLKCNCGSSFNRKVYHKKDDMTTYCFQCYNQKNNGSSQYRLKKGLDTNNSCDIPLLQQWKLELMGSIIYNIIWNDKEFIMNVANTLIEKNISNESINEELQEEKNDLERKIKMLNEKIDKLVDMYINNAIDKNRYFDKKKKLEEEINNFELRKNDIKNELSIPKNQVDEKIEKIKQCIENNLYLCDSKLPDEILDNFVEKIVVRKDRFEWKLNFLSDNEDDMLLTSINITQDDITSFFEKNGIFTKNKKIKNPIRVDIYV